MLSKSFSEWRLSVTFSADYLLDCIESNSPRPGEGVRPVPHVVLVDVAHADTLTQDVRSLAWIVTKRLDSHKMVENGIILFLQWEVLHVLGSVCDAEEPKWKSSSGPVWPGIAARGKGECRKYGVGRILRS
jgi:hypothetical protein